MVGNHFQIIRQKNKKVPTKVLTFTTLTIKISALPALIRKYGLLVRIKGTKKEKNGKLQPIKILMAHLTTVHLTERNFN